MENLKFTKFVTMAEEMKNEAKEREENTKNILKFGVPFLDDATIGILKNDLILVAGRSGQGKSELARHIAITNALEGKQVHFFALEDEPKGVTRSIVYKEAVRLFYQESFSFKNGERPSFLEWYSNKQNHLLDPYIKKATENISKYNNLIIRYRGDEFNMHDFEKSMISIKDETDLIVLDHLHYMDYQGDNENKAYKDMVKTIRSIAIYYGKPIVLVAHVRKANKSLSEIVPDLEDIHGSSDIYKIATKAILIAPCLDIDIRNKTPHRWPTYIRIAKCRHDGSRAKYTGLTVFNSQINAYEQGYRLGILNFKGTEWNEVPEHQLPHWVKRNAIVHSE